MPFDSLLVRDEDVFISFTRESEEDRAWRLRLCFLARWSCSLSGRVVRKLHCSFETARQVSRLEAGAWSRMCRLRFFACEKEWPQTSHWCTLVCKRKSQKLQHFYPFSFQKHNTTYLLEMISLRLTRIKIITSLLQRKQDIKKQNMAISYHFNTLEWVARWSFKCVFLLEVNEHPGWGHGKALPECCRRWALKLLTYFEENPQMSHSSLMVGLWVYRWACSAWRHLNPRPQSLHTNLTRKETEKYIIFAKVNTTANRNRSSAILFFLPITHFC